LFYLGRRDYFRFSFNYRDFRFLYFLFMNNRMAGGMLYLRMSVNRRWLSFWLRLDLCRMMRFRRLMMDNMYGFGGFFSRMSFYFMLFRGFLDRLKMSGFDYRMPCLFFLDHRGFMDSLDRFFNLWFGMNNSL